MHISFSLKADDLCSIVHQDCKGILDARNNYQVKCELVECHGKYPHRCGPNKCAIDARACDKYESFRIEFLRKRFDFYTLFNSYFKAFKEARQAKLNFFNQNIPTCPEKPYEFKPNHMCLNGVNCYEKLKPLKNSNHNYIIRHVNCTCAGIYNYNCNNSFCSISKQACDQFNQQYADQSLIKNGLSQCGNDNVISIRKFSFFSF